VFASLRHKTIRCGNHKDSAIHLSRAGNHVLYIVGVTGTVDVRVMALFGLILNMRGIDCDTTRLLFGSVINFIKTLCGFCETDSLPDGRDCGRECGFAVIDMPNGADINVGFCSFKFFFCHLIPPVLSATPQMVCIK